MNLLLICMLLVQLIPELSADYYADEKIEGLCDNPVIYAADRLLNDTIRLYRGNHYWVLHGMPDREGFLTGPFRIWQPNLAPIRENTNLMTQIYGFNKGTLYKFEGKVWWAWTANGYQWGGGSTGAYWSEMKGDGYQAMFHNVNESNPLAVCMESIYVRYFNQIHRWWYPVGDKSRVGHKDNGYVGGQFGENFPPDVTAAFSRKADKPEDGYEVYLFRKDKYCYRPQWLKSGKNCDEWRDSIELFGCKRDATNKPPEIATVDMTYPTVDQKEPMHTGVPPVPEPAKVGSAADFSSFYVTGRELPNIIASLFYILYNLYFYIF